MDKFQNAIQDAIKNLDQDKLAEQAMKLQKSKGWSFDQLKTYFSQISNSVSETQRTVISYALHLINIGAY